jgi:hypothetical protein
MQGPRGNWETYASGAVIVAASPAAVGWNSKFFLQNVGLMSLVTKGPLATRDNEETKGLTDKSDVALPNKCGLLQQVETDSFNVMDNFLSWWKRGSKSCNQSEMSVEAKQGKNGKEGLNLKELS